MTAPTPPRRGQDALDALADAFDAVAPQDRAAAEQELLDADLDPRAVARRSAALAAAGAAKRSAPRSSAPVASTPRRWRRWAIAAALAMVVGAALLAGRQPSERLVRSLPAARTIEPPRARVAPPPGEDQPDHAAARPAEPGRRSTPDPRPARQRRGGGAPVAAVDVSTAMLALLPESMRAPLRSGALTIHEVEVDPTALAALQSPAFVEASAANAGHFVIAPTCRLQARGLPGVPVRERFGYPFPTVSAESPTAACEIVWNAEAAFAAGGGRHGRVTACGVASTQSEGDEAAQPQCWDGRFVSLAFVGRQPGPLDNPNALRSASLLRVFGLNDDAGVGVITQRPIGDEEAKYYRFDGKARRVRRHVAFEPPVVDDRLRLSADDFNCFDGSPELYDWKVIGRQDVLAPLSGEGIRLSTTASTGQVDAMRAMRRDAWVVEGSINQQRRVVLYIDSELYQPYWKIEYERRDLIATYACSAGWTAAGDLVVPLTSRVTRYDPRGGRIDGFTPYDQTVGAPLGDEDANVHALIAMQP